MNMISIINNSYDMCFFEVNISQHINVVIKKHYADIYHKIYVVICTMFTA